MNSIEYVTFLRSYYFASQTNSRHVMAPEGGTPCFHDPYTLSVLISYRHCSNSVSSTYVVYEYVVFM